MAVKSKVLIHPDKDEIIQMLTDSVPVRKISDMLAERYPKVHQDHLRISFPTLQEFKTNHLNLKAKVSSDIERERIKASKSWLAYQEVEEELSDNSAYQKALLKAASAEIDTRSEILKVFTLVESRIEALYNKINAKETIRNDEERLLQSYIDQLMKVMDQNKKYIEGYREATEHNINITVATSQVNLIRESIREALAECDPSLALKFMDKIHNKMQALSFSAGSGDEAVAAGHALFLNSALGKTPATEEFVDSDPLEEEGE
jgi:DNA-binding phage protein